jgi:hypothetical protein
MTKKKGVRRRIGDIVSIALGEGEYGFAVVLKEPLLGYFDYRSRTPDPPLTDILMSPIAFKLLTMNHAVTRGTWPVIGSTDASELDADPPWFFKQDPFTGVLTKTRDSVEWLPVDEQDAMRMERAAVWEPVHVVGRLRDHFAGVPNKTVEVQRPRPRDARAIPSTRA